MLLRSALRPLLVAAVSFSPSRIPVAPRACAAPAEVPVVPPPPALEEALGEDRALEVWERRPPGALPNNAKQAALVEWLESGPLKADPERFLYQCLRREPKLLLRAASLPPLRQTHETLSELLRESESPGRFANAIAHEPALLLASSADLSSAFKSLNAALGIGKKALARMLRREPGLLLVQTDAIEKRLEWLRSRLDIEVGGRMARVVQRAPLALLASTKTMESRLQCLVDECGVREGDLGKVVVRTPRLLHMPLSNIRGRMKWLRDESILPADGSSDAAAAFFNSHPDYFSMTPSECDDRLNGLVALGLDRAGAAGVIAAEPGVLKEDTAQLSLRARFFFGVLGGSPSELCAVPHLLTCDFAKVALLRHAFCLANGLTEVQPAQLLVKGDATFCTEVARCEFEELKAFEAEGKHLAFFQGANV